MNEVLHSSLGGKVARIGDRRIEFRYSGLAVTVLIAIPAIIWASGSLTLVVLVVMNLLEPQTLASAFMGMLGSAGCSTLVWLRLRIMGRFVVDAEARTFHQYRGRREIGRWSLDEVRRFERVWDPFHRGFGYKYWLVAIVPDGRQLRLGKGTLDQLAPIIDILSGWDLPAS